MDPIEQTRTTGATARGQFPPVLVLGGYFLIGAMLLIILSTIQKLILPAPIQLRGYIVPALYGGGTGALIGLWAERLRRQNRMLQVRIAERQYLLRDLHHRIQNNLQIVSSLIALDEEQGRGTTHLLNRIDLMASLHRVLHDIGADYTVELSEFIPVYAAEVCRVRCGCDGDGSSRVERVSVPLDTAVVIGMILNELVGYVDRSSCEPEKTPLFTLSRDDDACRLQVRFYPDSTAENIAGDKLIDILSQQIGAVTTTENDTTVNFTLRFRIDGQADKGNHIVPPTGDIT